MYTKLIIRVVLLGITLERGSRGKFKAIDALNLWFIILQQACILQKVFDPLLFIFNNNLILLFYWFGLPLGLFASLKVLMLIDLLIWLWILFLNITMTRLSFLEGGVILTDISLFWLVGDYNNFFFVFYFEVGCLNWAVSTFLALPLVKLTYSVNLSNDFSINGYSFLRIEFLFFQHA